MRTDLSHEALAKRSPCSSTKHSTVSPCPSSTTDSAEATSHKRIVLSSEPLAAR